MTTTTYKVSGMTCGHCQQAVTTEVAKLRSVTEVSVDLAAGTVTVTSDDAIDDSAFRAAVDEAGFAVVS